LGAFAVDEYLFYNVDNLKWKDGRRQVPLINLPLSLSKEAGKTMLNLFTQFVTFQVKKGYVNVLNRRDAEYAEFFENFSAFSATLR